MINTMTIAGLAVGLVGLVLSLLNLLGCFRSKKRVHFLKCVRESKEGIPRQTPGFDEFLRSFPPPGDLASVSHVVRDVVQTHDQYPISITLRYLAGGTRSEPVAAQEDVRRWAEKTKYRWLSWLIAFAGWVVVAVAQLIALWQGQNVQ